MNGNKTDSPKVTARKPEDCLIGKNAVTEAIKSGIGINRLIIAKGSRFAEDMVAAAKERGAVIQFAERAALDKITGTGKHQGVAAYVSPVPYKTLDDVLSFAEERGELPFVVLLDEIEDPHNVGAIIRSAEAAGAHGVLIPKRRCSAVNATVAKTSAGAVFHIPLVKIGNPAQTLRLLKERGVWIFGADASGTTDFNETGIWRRGVCIVIGNEGNGISRTVREECDFLVRIPMRGKVNSLNASAAAAVLLFVAVADRK